RDVETRAAAATRLCLRRLRGRPCRAFSGDGDDHRLPSHPRDDGAPGSADAACHDLWPLKEPIVTRPKRPKSDVDAGLLLADAAKLLPNPSRRLFMRGITSVGSLSLLTGCDIVDGPSTERALRVISQFNDWVQARLFDPGRLAEIYPESAITRPFRFNA